MKFGESLQQQSVSSFSRHNIDYDDIKHFIKDRTTPGKGKAVTIPGRGDDRLLEFENDLFNILKEQHDRINIFVKCKVGEVQRRQDDCNKLLRKISSRPNPDNDRRIAMSQLQRYGRLENDTVRAADDLVSLARFNANQKTAFRKLLKKYRKWTGSPDLEDRFRDEVLDDAKSFTKLDLGPLLDEYSSTRQQIRYLYEETAQQASGTPSEAPRTLAESSAVQTLRTAIESGSSIQFDMSLATTPLGRSGAFAAYFVHPDNVVELQMFLLQYASYFSDRSRSNSPASIVPSLQQQIKSSRNSIPDGADYHVLAADCVERFAQEQSALTVTERENAPGSTLQRAKAVVCWNHLDEAMVALRSRSGRIKIAAMKSKRVATFFEHSTDVSAKKDLKADAALLEIRRELKKDENVQPLFKLSCCRSRLVGHGDNPGKVSMMTLDTDISIQHPKEGESDAVTSRFPFAVLVIRQEGSQPGEFISSLDDSHLVERVRGFSMEHHALWQIQQPLDMSQPLWVPILDRDIRKLPPPALAKRTDSANQEVPDAPSTKSFDSGENITDSTTAVDTTNEASLLGSPPRKARAQRKHLRIYAQSPTETRTRYWSEYDHPENEENREDAYVLYVNPYERSAFDRFLDRAGKVFGFGSMYDDHEPETTLASPATDDDTSSDEQTGLTSSSSKRKKSYGAIENAVTSLTSHTVGFTRFDRDAGSLLPQVSTMCFSASLIILGFAYIMALTGRHRYIYEVQAGVIVAIVSSLGFAITAFLNAFRRQSTGATGRVISTIILILDGVGSGGLVAWCFL